MSIDLHHLKRPADVLLVDGDAYTIEISVYAKPQKEHEWQSAPGVIFAQPLQRLISISNVVCTYDEILPLLVIPAPRNAKNQELEYKSKLYNTLGNHETSKGSVCETTVSSNREMVTVY